jgi:hypothetical protein
MKLLISSYLNKKRDFIKHNRTLKENKDKDKISQGCLLGKKSCIKGGIILSHSV